MNDLTGQNPTERYTGNKNHANVNMNSKKERESSLRLKMVLCMKTGARTADTWIYPVQYRGR